MRLRRNADPTPRDLYSVASDAVKQARLVRGDKAKRAALMEEARKLYHEGAEVDRARIREARTPKFTPAPTPVPDELSQWSGLPKRGEVTVDGLAELLGVSDYEKIRDQNDHFIWETARNRFEGTDTESDEFFELQGDIENEELFRPWHAGVTAAADAMLGEHGLELAAVGRPPKKVAFGDWRPYLYRIVPVTSWRDAAGKIRETINGVGHFYTSSLKEFLDSGPWTARDAVLDHLHWMRRRPEVYGGYPYERIYERTWQ